MHYGWPLLRNLTLLSILTQWYSNNRKFRHNIQTASFPPLYYFVPHRVSTDVLSWCFFRQLARHRGTHRRRHLMHWKFVSCIAWAECGGRSRFSHQNTPKGTEFPHRKRLPRLEEVPPQHRHMPCLIRSRIMQSKRCLLGVREKTWVLGHQEISTRVGEQQVGAARKQQEESYQRGKLRIWRSFPVLS